MFTENKIKISIPQPCSENWNLMTSSEKGRFCENCEKEVIDFTKMNDEEILNFISHNKNKFCGMFSKSQIDRKIEPTKKSIIFHYRKLAASILTVLSFKFSYSQSNTKPRTETSISPLQSLPKTENEVVKNIEYIIFGKVKAERELYLLLESVKITIGNNELTTKTDSLGNFKITIDKNKLKEYTIIEFTHPLLSKEVRSIHKTNFPLELNIRMEAPFGETLMGVPVFDENGNIPTR
jgi:hypothetical protein